MRRSTRRPREDGYNLVVLMVMITVMNVGLAAVLPLWSQQIQREKEEELIFRGLQYAEAIRIFQRRFGRFPVKLEELLEAEPRSIRQLWPNPMDENGKWKPVYQGQGGRRVGQQVPPAGGGAGRPVPQPQTGGGNGSQSEVANAPIIGVMSPVGEEAIKTWNGSNTIADWRFTVEILPNLDPQFLAANPGLSPDLSSRFIGRPLPPDLEALAQPIGRPQQPGQPGQPGAGRPAGRPARPGQPAGPGQGQPAVPAPEPDDGGAGTGRDLGGSTGR